MDYSIQEEKNGQLSFRISTAPGNYVVQANKMIIGRQNLKLNEAKLIRAIIMQILYDDMDFKPYIVSAKEFAKLIGNCDASNIYRTASELCSSIMTKQLEITDDDGSWIKIQWVSLCKYDSKTGMFYIKLNDDLKPFLLGLGEKGYYTQYEFGDINHFSSIYALRIYELLLEGIILKVLPKKGVHVTLTKELIQDACMLYRSNRIGKDKGIESKFNRISQMKERVLDIACRDINKYTIFEVSYITLKAGKSIDSFQFLIKPKYEIDVALSR